MKKELQKRILSSLAIIPISLFFIIKGSLFFIFFLFIIFIATSYEWINLCKNKYFIKIMGIIFLASSFYLAYLLRIDEGYYVFIFVILISVFTDIGGYSFGKFLKGPKITKISPNKTYAGVIGGLLTPLIVGFIYIEYILPIRLTLNFVTSFEKYINFDLYLIFIILIISIISQIGDLVISYFKRLANIKDTGKLIPGHGGLLDRIDGIIFAMPFSYLLLNL